MRLIIVLLAIALHLSIQAQCPEFTTTSVTPSCNPSCDLCVNDVFTVNLTGGDLPNGGKVEYYIDQTPGFNPYSGQGSLIGTSMINTPGGNCRICPELMGFMIDACGTEAANEFIIMWTGSGFNTSNFLFDFATQNNTGGGGNADIGGGCTVTAGGAGSVGGCSATAVGAGFLLPANAVWVIFTSSAVSTSYDFSAVCALGLKVYVSKSSCTRTIGAFTNGGGTGTRTQGFSISGCGCGTSVTYDLQDPGLNGDGDSWAGGISNNGCSAAITGAGNYTPAKSTITPFTYKIPTTWCDKTFEIVGIVNPKPDPMCCKEIFTERFSISVKCPVANKSKIEECDSGNGRATFNLEDAEMEILGSSGGNVEWFKDMAGTMRIMSPYISTTTVVYARVKDGNCVSPLVPVDLIVTPFTLPRSTSEERCAEFDGQATFPLLNLENFIRNGNNTLLVKFYEDADKGSPIFPPYRTGTTTIYVATCKGDCESPTIPIKLIVNPLPIANDITKTECPEGDGKASFDLRIFIPFIIDSARNTIITFYKDSLLTDSIDSKNIYRTDSSIVYTKVSNGKCINKSKLILKVGDLKFTNTLVLQQCPGQMQMTDFDLNILINQIQQGDTSIKVNFFEDSTLLNEIQSPYTTTKSITIYATFNKGNCRSNKFPIQLEVINKPIANPAIIEKCSDDDQQNFTFTLDSLKRLITNDINATVNFYSDINLLNKITGNFTTQGDTIYATSSLGFCSSDAVEIILRVNKSPIFEKAVDTSVCNSFILPIPKGQFITSNFAYYSQKDGQGNRFIVGDTIHKTTTIYRYDSLLCLATDSFRITIINSPNAGTDRIISVCEGTIVDLTKILTDADPGGSFKDLNNTGNLNGILFDSKGQNNKKINIKYDLPGINPCPGDSSFITINVVKQLSAGLDTVINLCSIDSVDMLSLLRDADPGGSFFDIIDRPTNSVIIASNFGFGQYDFKYVIGDGISCPKRTAIISIRFQRTTIIDTFLDVTACKYYVLQAITGVNTFNKTSYYSQPGRTGTQYSPGDTIFNDLILYAHGTDPTYCTNERKFKISIANTNIITINNLDQCPDYKFFMRGEIFDINRPNGTINLLASTTQECDTTININLSFLAPVIANFDTTLCQGSGITVNGNRYDEIKPVGIEIFKNASSRACDSTLNINLRFNKTTSSLYEPFICEKDSIKINGRIYNINNSTGQELLTNAKGCDSILNVQVQFYPNSQFSFNPSICRKDSFIINGTKYNYNQPSGIEILSNFLGCDSIINIDLNILPDHFFTFKTTLCRTESITLGNTVFDTNNTSLKTILLAASSNGCDSIVDIELNFYPEIRSSFTQTICPNQTLRINNTLYDINKPNGTEIFKGQGLNGCDSLVNIDLSFNSVREGTYATSICNGDSILIGKTYYSSSLTQGRDTLTSGSSQGCDSITTIAVSILTPSISNLNNSYCQEDFVIINGKRYDINNPVGLERIRSGSQNGCDSIININLRFVELDADLTSQHEIFIGTTIQFDLNPDFTPKTIQWSPSDGLSCTDCLNPTANPNKDNEYTVTLTDDNGCTIIRRVKVVVIKDVNVYVPNVFSPNGDGINDFLEIFSSSNDLIIQRYNIFDRWGSLIHSQENASIQGFRGWNGEFKGQAVNPGVYAYHIIVSLRDGTQQTLYGDITLLR